MISLATTEHFFLFYTIKVSAMNEAEQFLVKEPQD